MDYLSWDVIGKVAAIVFGAVVLGAALASPKGREALANVGVGLAALALRIAERAARDGEKAGTARAARKTLGK